MSRIEACFAALRERRERALIPFITAGDPDLEATHALVLAMAEAGADAVEIGVPFSDPTADGPTIQRSSERGIASGASLNRVLQLVQALRREVEIPLILMGYANPVYAMGHERFAADAAAVGVDGVIVADLPPEEGAHFYGVCRERGIDPILLAGPTTTPERLEMLARETRGFLYYVSLTGVTSARSTVSSGIEKDVQRARELGPSPVCVGFGISTPEHAREVGAYADGVIVGSAIVNRIETASSRDQMIDDVSQFVAELKAPLRDLS